MHERLMDRWMETMLSYNESDVKCIYYLSMEFLTWPTTIEQSSQRLPGAGGRALS
jgi:glucan phosphorylase